MKKLPVLIALISLAFALSHTSSAEAQVSADITLNGAVPGVCTIESPVEILTPTLDPSSSTTVTASGTLKFYCTSGVYFDMSVDNGMTPAGSTRRVKHKSKDAYMPYSLTWDPYYTSGHSLSFVPQVGKGFNNPLTVTFTVTFNPADYKDAPAGTYTDTVTVTVTPR